MWTFHLLAAEQARGYLRRMMPPRLQHKDGIMLFVIRTAADMCSWLKLSSTS
jgi:hypothetical protein